MILHHLPPPGSQRLPERRRRRRRRVGVLVSPPSTKVPFPVSAPQKAPNRGPPTVPRWRPGSPAEPLLSGGLWRADADVSRRFHVLPLVACPCRGLSGSVAVCGRSAVAAPQKGGRGGGGEGRIIPARCVSSVLICHPLNLYRSSTGSISHIGGTFAGTQEATLTRPRLEELKL